MSKYGVNCLLTSYLFIVISSCNNPTNNQSDTNEVKIKSVSKTFNKPPSTFNDTLIVNKPTALFYHPDSLQLARIKALSNSAVFDGTMHDFFYQMRNARMVIKKNWPALSIIDSKNYQVILFIKKDSTKEFINLDSKNDAYGLFVFNTKKSPLLVDMTNIETEISFYMKN